MTLVINWLDSENIFKAQLWTVADSRLSQGPRDKRMPLLNCGAKLFSIPVICSTIDEIGFFKKKYYTGKVGMAFAGSSLIGLNLHAFISHTFSSLGSKSGQLPCICSLAKHVWAAFNRLMTDYYTINLKCQLNPCEVSIFGFCPRCDKYELCHIYHGVAKTKVTFQIRDLSMENRIFVMGDHRDCIYDEIHKNLSVISQSEQQRYPIKFLEDLIKNEVYETIGGEIQLGISNPFNFLLYQRCKPVISGHPHATLKFQGIDLYSDPSLVEIDNDLFLNILAMA